MRNATASQTIGPYWHLIRDEAWADLTRFGAEGEAIELTGILTDGAGAPVTDACVELWQASPQASARFPAFGRAGTDGEGRYRFRTIRPGPVAVSAGELRNAVQAPHLALGIFARGLLNRLVTRAYFAGEALNEADPVLALAGAARRGTMIADPEGGGVWRLDIRLQGEGETVFLSV